MWPGEGCAPGVGGEPGTGEVRVGLSLPPLADFGVHGGEVDFRRVAEAAERGPPRLARVGEGKFTLAMAGLRPFLPVPFAVRAELGGVVAGECGERLLGQAGVDQVGGGADEGVADLDVGVEEGEGPAGVEGFQPERNLGEFGGQRVEVHPVQAVGDHVPHGGLGRRHRWFGFAGADGGEATGDAPGRGGEEMTGAAGRVAYGDREQGLLRISGGNHGVQYRVEGLVEQDLDEAGWGVVGAGGLAVVAGGDVKGEHASLGIEVRDELKEGLVDAAEFLGAEVAVVDRSGQAGVVADDRQRPDGGEQVGVGQRGGGQFAEHARLVHAAQAGQGELRQAGLGAQAAEQHVVRGPQVAMAFTADPPAGEPTQPRRGEVAGVDLARPPCGVRWMQQVAVLGDEQDEKLVDDAQQQPVVVAAGERSARQRGAQVGVGGVAQEATAQGGQRLGDSAAQRGQRPGTSYAALGAPEFQPAGVGAGVAVRSGFDPAGVGDQPQQGEVGEHLPVEHRFQVELDVGLAHEGGRVPQQPELQPVGDEPPQQVRGTVEQLLHHRMRCSPGCAGQACGAMVEADAGTEQVDRAVRPQVRHRICLAARRAVDGDATGGSGR